MQQAKKTEYKLLQEKPEVGNKISYFKLLPT
jgi:hypothetical protein